MEGGAIVIIKGVVTRYGVMATEGIAKVQNVITVIALKK